MAKLISVLTDDVEHCIVCGQDRTAMHHVFEGNSNRKLSEEDKYKIPLCYRHHNGSNNAIHFNKKLDMEWKRIAQQHYEETHSREDFIKRYGRSYL